MTACQREHRVKEESVFWLGGKPGPQKAAAAPPAAESLEPAIRRACVAQGHEPEDFVAALGGFGSWLVHFSADGRRQRIVWNGRDRKLVLQAALRSGGWEDLRDCPVATADEAAFTAGVATLLGGAGG
jgi:hypothetical protein